MGWFSGRVESSAPPNGSFVAGNGRKQGRGGGYVYVFTILSLFSEMGFVCDSEAVIKTSNL